MTKTELSKALAQKLDINQKEGTAVTDAVLETIADTLAAGEDVRIVGFGNFTIKDTAAREARNPKTGEVVSVEAGRKVSFKVSPVLKDAINGK